MHWMRTLALAFALALSAQTGAAHAQGEAAGSHFAALTAGLEAQHRAAIIRERGLADTRTIQLIAEAEARMRAAREAWSQASADRASAEAALYDARAAYVRAVNATELSEAMAAIEIEAFRAELEARMPEATPELIAAYQEFADGARESAWRSLEPLLRARISARTAAARAVAAGEMRQLARLREIMRVNGETNVADVLALWNRAAELDPNDVLTHLSRNDLYAETGQLDEQLAAARQARAVATDMYERAAGEGAIGGALAERRDYEGALRAYNAALEMHRALLTERPRNVNLLENVSLDLRDIGDVLMDQGELDAAARHYEEGLAVLRRVASEFPQLRTERNLANALRRTGGALMQAADLDGAMAHYEEALELLRRLAGADPRNIDLAQDLPNTMTYVGEVHRRRGDLQEAVRFFSEAVEVARRTAAIDPSNLDLNLPLTAALDRLGSMQLVMSRADAALATFHEVREIELRNLEASPDSPERSHALMLTESKLCATLQAMGRLADADPYCDAALERGRRLHANRPDDFDTARDLAHLLAQMSSVHLVRGQIPASRADATDAISILRRLHAQQPDNPAVLLPLGHALAVTADLLEREGDADAARRSMEEAFAVLERALRNSPDPTIAAIMMYVRASLARLETQTDAGAKDAD